MSGFNLFVLPSDKEMYFSIYVHQHHVVFECPWDEKDGRIGDVDLIHSGSTVKIVPVGVG